MTLIRYLIFEIVLIKVNSSEKEVQEKQGRGFEDGDAQQLTFK